VYESRGKRDYFVVVIVEKVRRFPVDWENRQKRRRLPSYCEAFSSFVMPIAQIATI